ncbi:heavy metal-associated isoprenylated plant protein 20-like [Setaria italica]|uniref:heavy metal-associated isoprenylated plant protein 20-like n=1 Tax=Setaria italica TaxID=4555 RepID=UPI000BE606C1|nr:heavy metal-associated isoprenylated plant protein 20-like [Setaria italica]
MVSAVEKAGSGAAPLGGGNGRRPRREEEVGGVSGHGSSAHQSVETVEVDREENKVTVTGDFEPEVVVKKIKKKTGKKVEILILEKDEEEEGMGQEPYGPYYYENPEMYPDDADVPDEFRSYRPERWNFDYFDDENAQACMIM